LGQNFWLKKDDIMRLIKIIIYGLILSVGAVSCGEKQTASSHIATAKSLNETSQINQVIIELKNAIQLEPKNAEARYLLGQSYLNQGSGVNAAKELEKALSLQFPHNEVIPSLARAYLLTEDDTGILSLDEHSDKLSNTAKAQYYAYKVLAALRAEDKVVAESAAALANTAAPNDVYALIASSYLKLANNAHEDAEKLIAQALVIAPNNPDALMLQGQISTAVKDYVQASKSYARYVELQPLSGIGSIYLTESLLKEQRFDEAEAYADSILTNFPNQAFAHYVKAAVKFQSKDYKAAKMHAEKALTSNFNKPYLQLIAGISAYFLNSYEQSYMHLKPVVRYLAPEHPARKMFAYNQLQLGLVTDLNESIGELNPTSDADINFLSSLSFQLAKIGAFEQAKEISEKLITQASSEETSSAESNMREGFLKLMLNDPSGIKDLEKAVEQDPNMKGAELTIAYLAIETGDFEQAERIAKKWQAAYPEKVEGFNIQAAIYIKQGNFELAATTLHKSLELQAENLFALRELTRLSLRQGKKDEAKQWSSKAILLFPKNVSILKQHYFMVKDDLTLEKIKMLYENEKTNIQYGMLYAEVLLELAKFNQADEVLASYPTSIKSPKKLWQLKIITKMKQNNNAEMQKIAQDWLLTNPYQIEPVLLLVNSYSVAKELNRALSLIDKAMISQPNNAKVLQLAKMKLLLDSNKVHDAKDLLQALEQQGLSETNRQGMQGRILLLEGDYVNALPLLERFYQAIPSSQNAIFIAVANARNNQREKAIAGLEQHLDKDPQADKIRALLANFYTQSNPEKAIQSYEVIVEAQPNNAIALNNLAWLNLESSNYEAALAYAEKAYELAGSIANISDTYGQVLLKSGDKVAALVKADEAYSISLGKDIDIALNYIELLILNNKVDMAKKLLTEVKPKSDKQIAKFNVLLAKL
tara:strand:- start:1839 stop:4637 length:2799 start_codon:yes stop_codon:yes gene_type:complete